MASEGPIVLSYYDSLLRESDVVLLNGRHWFNDNLIGFWFQYLENELYKDFKDIACFISPQVAYYVKAGRAEDAEEMLRSLDLQKKQLILLPVNDCSSYDSPGGTHWSLLIYQNATPAFEHYDSHKGSINSLHAGGMAAVMAPILWGVEATGMFPEVYEMDCTQQLNNYDCGAHVVCNSEAICRKYLRQDPRHISDIASNESIARSRNELKSLVYTMNCRNNEKA